MKKIQRLDKVSEYRLTSAIEKAASIMAAGTRDPNDILVEQLKAAGIDRRLSKVAAQAFNKRCTINFLSHTAEDKRDQAFPLADPELVDSRMGNTKQASIAAPDFQFTITKPVMSKAASVKVVKTYEATHTMGQALTSIGNLISKHASRYELLHRELTDKVRMLDDSLSKIASVARPGTKAFNVLMNHYGDRFSGYMESRMPVGTDFTKTASTAVLPSGDIFALAKKAFAAMDTLAGEHEALQIYGTDLHEFVKTATELQDLVHDKELFEGFDKTAGSLDLSLGMLAGATGGVASAAGAAVDTALSTTGDIASNIKDMYGSRDLSAAPASAISPDFISKDRHRDRLMAWNDIAADRAFALYPSEQVFAAAGRAMDSDPSLQRADKRELLRSHVGTLLPQSNRQSTADLASLAATLKSLSAIQGTGATQAAQAAQALSPVDKSPMPSLTLRAPALDVKLDKMMDRFGTAIDADIKERMDDKKTRLQEDIDAAKITQKELKGRAQKAKADYQLGHAERNKEIKNAQEGRVQQLLRQARLIKSKAQGQRQIMSMPQAISQAKDKIRTDLAEQATARREAENLQKQLGEGSNA